MPERIDSIITDGELPDWIQVLTLECSDRIIDHCGYEFCHMQNRQWLCKIRFVLEALCHIRDILAVPPDAFSRSDHL